MEKIPLRKKPEKKEKYGKVFLISNQAGEILIRKRTEKGLLSGLYEFPWQEAAEVCCGATDTGIEVSHVFTHFKLVLRIFAAKMEEKLPDGQFVLPEKLANFAMSTLMKKVYAAGRRILDNKG